MAQWQHRRCHDMPNRATHSIKLFLFAAIPFTCVCMHMYVHMCQHVQLLVNKFHAAAVPFASSCDLIVYVHY